MSDNEIKLMLAEDEKLVRYGLKTVIESNPGYKVICEAETGKDAVNKAIEAKPDIILLDLKLPDISGLKVLSMLKSYNSVSKTVILTSHSEPQDINSALSLGIYAYVIKDISEKLLLNVIKTVYNGSMWFDARVVPVVMSDIKNIRCDKKLSRSEFKSTHSDLTAREFEVLKLVVDGKSNLEIARELCISEHTAKAHVCNIIQKLLVEDRTQAAVKALKEGIIS